MLLGVLAESVLGNALVGTEVVIAGEGVIRAYQKVLMLSHLLTNFETQKYYKTNRNLLVFLQEIICLK